MANRIVQIARCFKKMLHVVKEVPTVAEMRGEARPKLRVRVPFAPEVHLRFDATTMFHTLWETSNMFDDTMPAGEKYVELSVMPGDSEEELEHNCAWFDRIGKEGLRIQGVTYRVIFGDWDDDGVAILVRADGPIQSLKDLGLDLIINKIADKPKVRKYFRRIRAHHEWSVSGKIIAGPCHYKNGQVLEIILDQDIYFQMLHVDLDSAALGSDDQGRKYNVALADGVHLIDVTLCQSIGKAYGIKKMANARIGDAFMGTALSYLGLGKGFFHVVNSPKFGIILYGPKKQVHFKDFFLGSLGEVDSSKPDAYTDIQSMINFGYHKNDLAVDKAILFIQTVVECIHDEAKLRHLFLTTLAPFAELLSNEQTGGRDAWVLLDALSKGVPVAATPGMNAGLFRRVCRHLLTHVLDATKGRIPMMSSGARFHLMPDLNCFLEDGSVDYRLSSIPEDCVVGMDLNMGQIVMWRSPSGNPMEALTTTNVHDRRFRAYRGRNRIICGPSAHPQLNTMGTADMDDAVTATDDLAWVETIANNRVYPITALPEATESKVVETVNKYRRGPSYPRCWSMTDFFEAVAAAKEHSLTIGVLVNALIKDALLSGDHKENMLCVLADMIPDAEPGNAKGQKNDLKQRYDKLRNRKDHILRAVGSHLDDFIDMVKMGTGDVVAVAELLKLVNDVRNEDNVIPAMCMIKNKRGFVRVAPKVLEENNYIVLPSLVCDTLARIKHETDQLQEALAEEQWLNVDSIPESLSIAFPRDQAAREEAIMLRSEWRDAFQGTGTLESKYKSAVEQVVNPSFKQWGDDDLMMQIAVEHARLTYKGRKSQAERGEDGKFRNYPDGLLWTNTIGSHYIKALEAAGLTGLYVPVMFDRWSRNFSRGHFEVSILSGVVIKKDDGTLLGTTRTAVDVENGNYPMTDGMITIMEPAAELRESRSIVNEEFDNPFELDYDFVGIN